MEYDPDRIHRNSSVMAEVVHTAIGGDETCTELDFQDSHAEYPADEVCDTPVIEAKVRYQ